MASASEVLFLAGMVASAGAAITTAWNALAVSVPSFAAQTTSPSGPVSIASSRRSEGVTARAAGLLTTVLLGSAVASRVIEARRPPYSNLWEYFLVLAFGISIVQCVLAWRTRDARLGVLSWPLVAVLLFIAHHWFSGRVEPLIPALQNNRLLALHVASMLIAYSAMGVAFAAAFAFLIQSETSGVSWLPSAATAEEVQHSAVLIGFPIMGIGIALGAYWGNIAWGRYWGWDPKETTALASWLVYAGYMHARALSGWRGRRTSGLVIAGFALILVNIFVVNFVISGLHSYAGT